jgi:hypothetical protein
MVIDGSTINYSKKCQNINVIMGNYFLYIRMIVTQIGGDDVIFGVQWLQSLGKVDFNFWELFMIFFLEGKEMELRGMQGKTYKVIISNSTMKLLKKRHHGVIA